MKSTLPTLAQLKKCGSGFGGSWNKAALQVAINTGHDSKLYVTNSYALAPIAPRLAPIWEASNLVPAPGVYSLTGHVQLVEGTPPALEAFTKALPATEVERVRLGGKLAFVGWSGGDLLVLQTVGDDPTFTYVSRDLTDVWIGSEDDIEKWTGDGPTKPVAAWGRDGAFLGLLMPVRV